MTRFVRFVRARDEKDEYVCIEKVRAVRATGKDDTSMLVYDNGDKVEVAGELDKVVAVIEGTDNALVPHDETTEGHDLPVQEVEDVDVDGGPTVEVVA